MADNVDITPGSGATVGTDERVIAGNTVQVQRMDEQGSTSISTSQVTPTTTAATLIAKRDTRKRVIITNNGSVDVYVGPATVTTANGFKIPPGYTLTLRTIALIQAIIASGTMVGSVHITEEFDA